MAQDVFGKSRIRKENPLKKIVNSYKTASETRSERVRGRQDYMKQKSSAQSVPGTMKGQQVDTTKGPTYTSSRASTAPSTSVVRQSDDVLKQGPNYNIKSEKNMGTVDRNVQDYEGSKGPDYSVAKETATGTLSAKTETTSSDRMSWAREAERKARKMMGGR